MSRHGQCRAFERRSHILSDRGSYRHTHISESLAYVVADRINDVQFAFRQVGRHLGGKSVAGYGGLTAHVAVGVGNIGDLIAFTPYKMRKVGIVIFNRCPLERRHIDVYFSHLRAVAIGRHVVRIGRASCGKQHREKPHGSYYIFVHDRQLKV